MSTAKSGTRIVKKGFKLFEGPVHGASILSGMVDRYNGIQIITDDVDQSTDPAEFRQKLLDSLSVYR